MLNFSLYRKELGILEIAKDQIGKNDCSNGFAASVQELFFESLTNLRPEFLEIIPVEKLESVRILLSFLTSIRSWGGGTITSDIAGTKTVTQVLTEIIELEKLIREEVNKKFHYNVFYSWQADSTQKYNRNFIEECLESAIKRVNQSNTSDPSLSLDKDTRNIPGSPDIVTTILQKIDRSVCFVADVSPVCKLHSSDKCIPNPNVMFELGYAFSSLNYERIILICNTAYCAIKDLPFDLGLKRVMAYKYDDQTSDEEKKACKARLIEDLQRAISASMGA